MDLIDPAGATPWLTPLLSDERTPQWQLHYSPVQFVQTTCLIYNSEKLGKLGGRQ
jgi:hypothetical protein